MMANEGGVITAKGSGNGKFSGRILDEYGAPRLSQLTECRAPEVSPLPNHMGAMILNAIFHGADFPKPTRRGLLNFLRRLQLAINEYGQGREKLLDYVVQLPDRNNHFLGALRALSHFEQSLAALYQAADLMAAVTGQELFKDGDGSPMQRLNLLYNRSKHFKEGATSPHMPATPVWLINDGFECSDCSLTYREFIEIMAELTKFAEMLGNLPQAIKERRAEAAGIAEQSTREPSDGYMDT